MRIKLWGIATCLLFLTTTTCQAQSGATPSTTPRSEETITTTSTTTATTSAYHSDLAVDLTFTETATSKGVFKFKLTNTSPTQFVKNYQFAFPATDIAGLVLLPGDQEITKEEKQENNITTMMLEFTNEVVGQGKSREFSVEMNLNHLLQTKGLTKVISIPAIPDATAFTTYQTNLRLPTSWGEPHFNLEPTRTASSAGAITYEFNQNQGENISVIYGDAQYLQFSYQGTLTNKANSPAYAQYHFPTNRDKVELIYTTFSPQPTTWRQADDDRTWQPFYLLGAGGTINLQADGYLVLHDVSAVFNASQYFPELEGSFNAFNIDEIPAEATTLDLTQAITTNLSLHRLGIFPWLNRYALTITNNSGHFINDLGLNFSSTQTQTAINPAQTTISLVPWQKAVIIVKTRPQPWYLPYQTHDFAVTISHEENTVNQNSLSSLLISYQAFALAGGFLALAVTAGSILVARLRK